MFILGLSYRCPYTRLDYLDFFSGEPVLYSFILQVVTWTFIVEVMFSRYVSSRLCSVAVYFVGCVILCFVQVVFPVLSSGGYVLWKFLLEDVLVQYLSWKLFTRYFYGSYAL